MFRITDENKITLKDEHSNNKKREIEDAQSKQLDFVARVTDSRTQNFYNIHSLNLIISQIIFRQT